MVTASGPNSTHSGRCSSPPCGTTSEVRQNSWAPSPMKKWLKAMPANSAPSARIPSGTSITIGDSCTWFSAGA